MSDPVYQSVPLSYFYSDTDPTASEAIVDAVVSSINDSGIPSNIQSYLWWNQTDNVFWRCVDTTPSALVWQKTVVQSDLTALNLGNINQPRSYVQWSDASLDTSRTPNTTKDVSINVTVDLVSTLLLPAMASVEIDMDGTWTTIGATEGLSDVAATSRRSINVLIPANCAYRITSSGNVSLVQVWELSN